MHRGLPWAGAVSAESVSGGSGTSAQESPPRTPRRFPRTHARRWSQSPPTRSLYACDDDAII